MWGRRNWGSLKCGMTDYGIAEMRDHRNVESKNCGVAEMRDLIFAKLQKYRYVNEHRKIGMRDCGLQQCGIAKPRVSTER